MSLAAYRGPSSRRKQRHQAAIDPTRPGIMTCTQHAMSEVGEEIGRLVPLKEDSLSYIKVTERRKACPEGPQPGRVVRDNRRLGGTGPNRES